MCATFACFLAALLAFESGWDRDRFKAGIIQEPQLNEWAKGPVKTHYPGYTSWSQLTDTEWDAMSYRSMNSLGFVGYQFGEALLIDLGYYKDDVYYGAGAASNTWDGTWTGKNGANSLDDFKTGDVQNKAIREAFGYNLQILENQLSVYGKSLNDYIGQTRSFQQNGKATSVKLTLSGILAASHLRGAWGTAALLLDNAVTADENGTSILQYINQFGSYETPSIDTMIAFHKGKVIGDEGLGSLLIPGQTPPAVGSGDSHTPRNIIDAGLCSADWHTANLTNYVSYPQSGSEECDAYNGCQWAGQFYGLEGQQSEEWVSQNNIVAVHMKDWGWLGMKSLRLRQDGRTITAKVVDACSDTDCEGCCTANLGGDGYLIDIEKYTMERFQSGEGLVEFQVCDGATDTNTPDEDFIHTPSPGHEDETPGPLFLGSDTDTIKLGYAWGQFQTVEGFNPSEDILDFGSLAGADVLIENTVAGLKITVKNNGGSGYLLKGVGAADIPIDKVTAALWNPAITEAGGIADQLRELR